MNRCPTCKGRIDTALARCTRCDMDVSCLIRIEDAQKQACILSIQSLVKGNIKQAQAYALKAFHLKKTPMTQALCLFVQD